MAAPSNWKYYDTVYTERYMRTPKENAEGYAVNPIQRAQNLSGDQRTFPLRGGRRG